MIKFFVTLFISLSVLAKTSDYYQQNQALLDEIGIDRFYKDIKQIKKYPNLNYVDEKFHHLKKYALYWNIWKNFDEEEYRNNLSEKIQVSFSFEELQEITSFYKNLFNAKLYKQLLSSDNLIALYNQILTGEVFAINIKNERMEILKKYYSYFGFFILESVLENKLKKIGELPNRKVRVFDYTKGQEKFFSPQEIARFSLSLRRGIISMISEGLKNFSNNELNYFLKNGSHEKVKKINQLILNFHHLFILDNLYQTEELNFLILPLKER